MKKKVLSIATAIVMTSSLIPSVYASSTTQDTLQYPHNGGATPAIHVLQSDSFTPYQVVGEGSIDFQASKYTSQSASILDWFKSVQDYNAYDPSNPTVNFSQMKYNDGFVEVGKGAPSLNNIYRANIYDDVNLDANNGYFMLETYSPSDPRDFVGAWTNLLGGNSQYVQSWLNNQQQGVMAVKDDISNAWRIVRLRDFFAANGAQIQPFKYGGVDFMVDPSDPTQAEPFVQVLPTPAPTSSVLTDKSTYGVGSKITITGSSNDYASPDGSSYHATAIEVTGPNGYDKFLPLSQVTMNGANEGSGSAASGTSFPYNGVGNGTAAFAYGYGSGDPSTPNKIQDIATFETSGLATGSYSVEYTFYDGVGREATNGIAKSTFTLDNSAPTGGGTKGQLEMHFGTLPSSVKMGSTFTAPIIISNNGSTPVTTNLTFTLSGTLDQSYQTTETYTYTTTDPNTGQQVTKTGTRTVTKYHNLPLTETLQSGSVTIQPHGKYTWNVSSGLTWNISGGSPSTLNGSLNAGSVGKSDGSGIFDTSIKYFPTLTVKAQDAADYVSPTIQAYVGTNYSNSQSPPVHLTH